MRGLRFVIGNKGVWGDEEDGVRLKGGDGYWD